MLTDEVVAEFPARPGALGNLFQTLARARVETLGVASERFQRDGSLWRRVRLLCRDRSEGAAALKHAGVSVKVNPVIYLQVEVSVDRLDWALQRLEGAGIDVEALYHAYAPGGPGLVLVTSAPEKAAEVL